VLEAHVREQQLLVRPGKGGVARSIGLEGLGTEGEEVERLCEPLLLNLLLGQYPGDAYGWGHELDEKRIRDGSRSDLPTKSLRSYEQMVRMTCHESQAL
jgi:hypothetical protein